MLRSELGDSAFFAGVRDYYTRHKHGTAITADLQAALQRTSGKNLQAFFDQWLRRPGYPEITVAWAAGANARGTTVSVTQSERFGYFELPLPIALVDRSGARRSFTIPVGARAVTRFDIDYPSGEIARVIVDPNVTVLARDLTTIN
jgi:aminopeptidase N